MSDHRMGKLTLDARPDRIDFRDRPYRPPLVSLPPSFPADDEVERFLPIYLKHRMVRHQGTEGACTGFGLAAVIDYIFWERLIRERAGAAGNEADGGPDRVSAFMLYDVAKLYDEWDGEDYSGSSCRGAMKGWHKHGVCAETLWRKSAGSRDRPDPAWHVDAARRPLGAYYRVDARSISDMQAAIHEVRAVYCSARVHQGWLDENLIEDAGHRFAGRALPCIPDGSAKTPTGGHAFAIVGYNGDGFVIQNSWGSRWGYRGFALLTYADWIAHGNDAWVAALAAPMRVSAEAVSHNRTDIALTKATPASARAAALDIKRGVQAWSEKQAYDHSIVLGNEGALIRRRADAADAVDNLRLVAFEGPLEAAQAGRTKLLIYAHGGLNSERSAIERVTRMGPWLAANGIHPLFLVWRTSLLESLANIAVDFVGQFKDQREELLTEGLGDVIAAAVKKLQNAFDKSFETAAEKTIGKPVWSQMKQNAHAAADGDGGLRQLFNVLGELKGARPDIELHIAGHSAGAILLGHMLDDFAAGMRIDTTTLFAPACTTRFALRHYGRAAERGVLPAASMHIDVLSNAIEREDNVGPYGKSLLYLVSRALETPRKAPLLGLALCLAQTNEELKEALEPAASERARLANVKELLAADFADDHIRFIRDWHDLAQKHQIAVKMHGQREVVTKLHDFKDTGQVGQIDPVKTANTHGAFDNNIHVMNALIARVLGSEHPKVSVTDLTGF